ncbi:MAG: hypothetical protein EBT86_13245 [Actinobacteria bacterium]|nr:hypothetical protein [Actinomycetota bacterium]
MAKSNTIHLQEITDLYLENQIAQILIGKGIRQTYGLRLDINELAEELVFALDFVNGEDPYQPIALNTLPDLTGEDGIPAIDLVKYFGLEDYIVESVLNG